MEMKNKKTYWGQKQFFPISTRTYEKHFNTVDPGIDQKVKEYI